MRRFSSAAAPRLFDKVLVANRGEIACRVIKSAKSMGIRTVAVYSEADAHSMHVDLADEAFYLGGAAAADSYLKGDSIIKLAKKHGVGAIHPGYGFLSENEGFADACERNGIAFVGPPSSAIKAMGSKSASKIIMEKANVPVVPGYHGDNQDPAYLKEQGDKTGYPLLIKAVLGGGGKGMRIVNKPSEFMEALEGAKRESMASFSDDRVILERYLVRPRHIELQVFADKKGNTVHLFERDCSVQRRHQKVLEEAPAPGMTDELRLEMGTAAVNATKAVNYVGAGTVEFIFDIDTNKFFFMEMNTRLQVEHPVTEMITGQDLVEWQLRIAAGYDLPKTQDELTITGHSIEARIYAEDPDKDFMPMAGDLRHVRVPTGDGVRVDTGVRGGQAVTPHYDPMISKLVVWDVNRQEAIRKLNIALSQYQVVGLPTNISFLRRCSQHPAFGRGDVETGFIPKYHDDIFPPAGSAKVDPKGAALAALAITLQDQPSSSGLWGGGFRVNGAEQVSTLSLSELPVSITQTGPGHFKFDLDGQTKTVTGSVLEPGRFEARIDGDICTFDSFIDKVARKVHVWEGNDSYTFDLGAPDFPIGGAAAVGAGAIVAPMPGKITAVKVKVGQHVEAGDTLVVMEAMKMEHILRAQVSGVVEQLPVSLDELVDSDTVLVVVTPADDKKK